MAGRCIPGRVVRLCLDFDRGPAQIPLGLSEPVNRTLLIFLLAAGILFGSYLALPLWLPAFVQAQLTQGWQLESLAFDYPFSTTLHVNNIVVGNKLDGIELRVTAQDLKIDVYQSSLDAGSMNVNIDVTKSPGESSPFSLDDLQVPVIIRPGKLPRISIGSLRVKLQTDGVNDESWLFEDLQLDRNLQTESRLRTTLPLPELEGLTGLIEIGLSDDLLEAQLQLQRPDNSKALQINFRQTAGGQEISSEITGQGQLQALQPLLTALFPDAGLGSDQLKHIEGYVSFEGHFAGSEEQILDRARISTQNVMIELENKRLGLELDVEVQREQHEIQINFLGPAAFHFDAKNEFISGLLSEFLPLNPNANSAEGVSEELDLTIEALSKIKLQTSALFPAGFRGAASLELSSNLLELSLELDQDSQFGLSELLAPQSLTGTGTINLKLNTGQAFSLETTASPSMPLGASLEAEGQLELDGNTIRFTQSSGFRVFTPRLIADFDSESLDFRDLALSGIADFSLPVVGNEPATELHFSGNVHSKSAVISQSDPGQAPQTLIVSESMDLQLEVSFSGEQLHSNGMGALQNIRMDSSGISANQVNIEWNKLDLLAVNGEFRTHTRGLVFSHEVDTYRGIDLDVTFALLSEDRIKGRGELHFDGDIPIPIRFNGRLGSEDWLVDILPSQLSLHQAASALEIANTPIPAQLKLGGGTIDIKGRFKVGSNARGNMEISGKGLSFSLDESTVEGADIDISGIMTDTLTGSGSFFIDRIGLAAGLSLFQVRGLIVSLTPDVIDLQDLQAEFFGGHLVADRIKLSPEGLSDTKIKLTGIDLGQVLEYLDVGGLQGSGDLKVSLPAGSQGTSLYIQNGAFRANGPGTLRYSASISTTPTENIGLSALENFHFSELDGTVDFNPDGSYRLKVHLVGSNPDLYNGYPIALNLNIGGMLPEAFEVLFLTGDFEKAIMNRIKQEPLD